MAFAGIHSYGLGVFKMIDVNIDGSRGFTVKGHAGSAPKGQDLVCAAVSTLVQTLAEGLRQEDDNTVWFLVNPGDASFGWDENIGPAERADAMVTLTLCGLGALSREHPDNIRITATEH